MHRKQLVEIEILYQLHGPALLSYLQRAFGRRTSAEDLLQETFVRAMRHPEHFANAKSPRAFLFGIARNVGLGACRIKTPATNVDFSGQPSTKDMPSPLTADPELTDMRRAITTLPPQMRETLELRLRDELTYEEIAVVLEVPVGTIRSRLHTSLRLLREQLRKEPS